MRLILVTQDFPPDVGGTQTYAYELANRMANWCEDFAVVAPYVPGCEGVDVALPYDVIRVSASYNLLGLKACLPVTRLACDRNFDTIFHVQWTTVMAGLYAKSRSPIEYVYAAAHGRELLLRPFPLLNGYYQSLRKKLLKQVDLLFPVSHYTRDLLLRMGVVRERTRVVHNGVNTDRFHPRNVEEKKQALGLCNRKVLLTVCRLVQRKGVDTVIKALPEIVRAVPEVVYVVAGTGSDRYRLEQLANEMGVAEYVLFVGYVPDEELNEFYNLCDIFTMPAHHQLPDVEGFGLVFLEAGATGKPSVGSTAGGIPDAIKDGITGVLIPPDNPEILAHRLIHLLTNPDLAKQLGSQARALTQKEGNWDYRVQCLYETMQEHSFSNEVNTPDPDLSWKLPVDLGMTT